MLVEVEVRSIAELIQAVSAEPVLILFDNMSPDVLHEALLVLESTNQSGSIISEASGGIGQRKLVAYAET